MRKGSQTLKRVVDQDYLRVYLGRKARRFWPDIRQVGRVRIDELSKEKFKRSFKYTVPLRLAGGRTVRWVIRGNVPSRHRLRELETAHWTQRLLRQHGLSHGRFLVPRSLGFDRELRLFLYADCPGASLVNALKQPSLGRRKSLITGAAEWLATFHGLKLRGRRVWARLIYIRDISYFKKDFARAGGDWLEVAQPVLENLRRVFDDVWADRRRHFSLTHGDFSPYNIIIHRGQLTAIDFGNAAQADPLFDLASFTIQLELLGARGRLPQSTVGALSRWFLCVYWHKTNKAPLRRAAVKFLGAYRAWWLVQAAAYIISVEPINKNRGFLRQTLDWARRELDSVRL